MGAQVGYLEEVLDICPGSGLGPGLRRGGALEVGGEWCASLGLRLEGLEGRVPEPGSRPDSSCSPRVTLDQSFLSLSFCDRSGEMEAGQSAESWYTQRFGKETPAILSSLFPRTLLVERESWECLTVRVTLGESLVLTFLYRGDGLTSSNIPVLFWCS